ncbi:MAG: hypothetical protein R3185_09035, partial [Candidatus Thermoplasmatota archaeon]|nr:hypothetical protein [Candidatus Thermoplasmatota archaeon]
MRPEGTVALLLASLLLAPVGSALPWDDTFTIPEPRSGDAGLYEPREVRFGDEVVELTGEASLAFELADREPFTDAYGLEQQATQFRAFAVSGNESFQLPWTSWVHTRGPAPLASSFAFGFLGPGFGMESESTTFTTRDHEAWGPECLLITALQGVEVQEGTEIPVRRMCGQAFGEGEDIRSVRVKVAEVETLEGGLTGARFVVTAEADYGEIVADLWYRSDIPYPLEIHTRGTFRELEAGNVSAETSAQPPALETLAHGMLLMAGQDPNEASEEEDAETWTFAATVALTRFQRGQGPAVPAGDLPDWPQVRAGVELAKVSDWGPVDGGETFTLSHEAAVNALEEDPRL